VNGLSFDLANKETLGLVGETGAGKTTTALSIMRLIPNPPGKIVGGEILFKGDDILRYNKYRLLRMRGRDISMIFQDPMTSLNPVLKWEIDRRVITSTKLRTRGEHYISLECWDSSTASTIVHQFSGGMKQRWSSRLARCNPNFHRRRAQDRSMSRFRLRYSK